ncbi:DUF6538 domain-containing protein [Pectobacterium polaris]|uniref:DUF6538 domain-containing protein n=1 Tax=Pectobacterium polaris TaxID=2042057 RepID=UPI003464949A
MSIMIQPTKNRFGVYIVRKTVPRHLQGILNKREIKFTLDTKDVREARERAPAKNHSDRHDAQAGRKSA